MIKIVSWNVNGKAPWTAVRQGLPSVDIGLFQEAPRPSGTEALQFVPSSNEEWATTRWPRQRRTCIARYTDAVQLAPMSLRSADDNLDDSAVPVSRGGSLTVAKVLREDRELFTLVSAYSAWETPPSRREPIFADASAHRLLSDLSALITGPRSKSILVAGDFNILHGYGEHGDSYWKRRYDTVFDRAEAMGLRFVGPQYPLGQQADPWPSELPLGSLNVPTFGHAQAPETATRQLDFVFATPHLADAISVRALNEPDQWGPSDHCRVAISVDR